MDVKGVPQVEPRHRPRRAAVSVNALLELLLASPEHEGPTRDALKHQPELVYVGLRRWRTVVVVALLVDAGVHRRQNPTADVGGRSGLVGSLLFPTAGRAPVHVLRCGRTRPLRSDAAGGYLEAIGYGDRAVLEGAVHQGLRRQLDVGAERHVRRDDRRGPRPHHLRPSEPLPGAAVGRGRIRRLPKGRRRELCRGPPHGRRPAHCGHAHPTQGGLITRRSLRSRSCA
mmetsp:Transcript_76101/g.219814  ORF Transcript_76101/g.219814 Transcript_76101/m.219814 type:complete len:228 (+) Transcript_76101:706-1389(+)